MDQTSRDRLVGRPPPTSRSAEPAVRIHDTPPAGWDDMVRSAPDASFCHLSGWQDVLEGTMGVEYLFLTAEEKEGLIGGLPLARMRRLPTGRALVSVPYLNYGGPAGPDAARSALVERARHVAREAGDRRIEIRSRGPVACDLPAGREKVTVVLDLPDQPDALFEDAFKAKLRSQIRRPMKEGMETRFGPEQMAPFYAVFARVMRDLGTPVLPLRFFDTIRTTFPDLVEFGVVYLDDTPVAGGCGFHWRDEFEMTWASALWEYNRLAPNMLLYWAFMERCIELGRHRFNFGRCTPGGGTHRFKTQWGEARDEPLHWLQWPAEVEAPDADSGPYDLATRVWRRLPMPVANRLGPMVARRLPTF